ncbi:MAG: hypothetical protein FJ202_11760 [Gemmatimonadetes bacterium]|nr:hypothetical protein [Gemmatimonadota bacterium]
MSGGEFIPNGSIHWDIEEEDVTNNGGNLKRDKKRPNLRGRDPIHPASIGRAMGAGKKDHPGELLVTLRFPEGTDVGTTLQNALKTLKLNRESRLLEIEVIVPVNQAADADAIRPSPNDWAQARVEW